MPRLFTAIELPEALRSELYRLKMPLPGARWVEPENLHLTLRFAGDVSNIEAREFASSLSQIVLPAFEITIRELGIFGGSDPRVIWAAVEGGDALDRLQRANERAARAAGLPPEGRAFKPHITLARLRYSNPDAIARFLSRRPAIRLPPVLVDRFVLMSSRPKVGGGPYVVEEDFPLEMPWAHADWQQS